MNALLEAGTYIGFFAVVLGANLFILFYGPFVRWWEKPFGKHLFSFMLVLAVILDHNVIQTIFGMYPGIWIVNFILTWLLVWVVWWRLKILLTVQIGRRHEGNSHSPAKVPQDSNDGVDRTDGADAPVVEGVDPLGRGDERMG